MFTKQKLIWFDYEQFFFLNKIVYFYETDASHEQGIFLDLTDVYLKLEKEACFSLGPEERTYVDQELCMPNIFHCQEYSVSL